MISLAKAAADPAGHYARPDVTRLLLDKTPGDRVVPRQRRSVEVERAGDDEPAVAARRAVRSAGRCAAPPEPEPAMESAIPAHLRSDAHAAAAGCPTTMRRPTRRTSRATQPSVKRVVMAYFGLQYRGDDARPAPRPRCGELDAAFAADQAPGHWDRARYIDEAGFTQHRVDRATGTSRRASTHGSREHGATWTDAARCPTASAPSPKCVRPAVERYETLFSADDRAEGIAVLADGMSDMVQEHAYWGGARDRIPLSQTDAMRAGGAPRVVADGARHGCVPHEHLCLIRSGQDWSDTGADERAHVPRRRRAGAARRAWTSCATTACSIGCYANRYMTRRSVATGATPKRASA